MASPPVENSLLMALLTIEAAVEASSRSGDRGAHRIAATVPSGWGARTHSPITFRYDFAGVIANVAQEPEPVAE